jgi:hypothetical protein
MDIDELVLRLDDLGWTTRIITTYQVLGFSTEVRRVITTTEVEIYKPIDGWRYAGEAIIETGIVTKFTPSQRIKDRYAAELVKKVFLGD